MVRFPPAVLKNRDIGILKKVYATENYSQHYFLESSPNKNFLSFYGGFMTNFCVPDYMGIGKLAAMGKGIVQEIHIYRDN